MLLELSDYELSEIYALHEMYYEGYFGLTDTEVVFSVSLANDDVNDDSESFGVYSFILHMYNEKIDIDSIDREEITSVKDTLIASKEFF